MYQSNLNQTPCTIYNSAIRFSYSFFDCVLQNHRYSITKRIDKFKSNSNIRLLNISEQLITFIPIAAVFSAIVTLIIRRLNEKRSKIERTIRLHESYLNPDFYQKVRAPSSVVGIQWMHLPEELKQIYRHTVCSGWEMQQGDEKLLIYVPDFPKNEKEIVKYHFNDVKSHGGLTEHQSLTSIT